MRTLRTLLFGLLTACFAVSSLARSYDDIIASGKIIVAVYNNFPPYSFQQDGKAAGIDVDLASQLAKGLGVEPEFLWIEAGETTEDDLRNAIWKGHIITKQKADLMMRVPYDRKFSYAIDGYGLPKNDLVAMFGPYHKERWAILRDHAKTNDIRTLAIFQYEDIAVQVDSLPSFFLGGTLQGRLRDHLVHTLTIYDGIDLLKDSKVAAVAGMQSQLEWGLGPLTDQYDISPDGLAAMSIKQWDIGMAVQSDYRQLAYALEGELDKLANSGQLKNIFAHYGVSYLPSSMYAEQ